MDILNSNFIALNIYLLCKNKFFIKTIIQQIWISILLYKYFLIQIYVFISVSLEEKTLFNVHNRKNNQLF